MSPPYDPHAPNLPTLHNPHLPKFTLTPLQTLRLVNAHTGYDARPRPSKPYSILLLYSLLFHKGKLLLAHRPHQSPRTFDPPFACFYSTVHDPEDLDYIASTGEFSKGVLNTPVEKIFDVLIERLRGDETTREVFRPNGVGSCMNPNLQFAMECVIPPDPPAPAWVMAKLWRLRPDVERFWIFSAEGTLKFDSVAWMSKLQLEDVFLTAPARQVCEIGFKRAGLDGFVRGERDHWEWFDKRPAEVMEKEMRWREEKEVARVNAARLEVLERELEGLLGLKRRWCEEKEEAERVEAEVRLGVMEEEMAFSVETGCQSGDEDDDVNDSGFGHGDGKDDSEERDGKELVTELNIEAVKAPTARVI